MASEIRVNKIENRSGLGTVTFADTGVDLAGIVTATTFSGSGASLTNVPDSALSSVTASKLSGALPALDGSALTGVASTENIRTNTNATFLQNINVSGVTTVGSAVTISESGIEASGIGITCANINGTQIGGRRNIIINGAMTVAQRGTSSTSTGYQTVDRYQIEWNGGGVTQAQVDISSSDTPYTLGFRKALKLTNTSTATGAGNYRDIRYYVEAQDIANSGWDLSSSSSNITLSFWVKASVAQTYYFFIYAPDSSKHYTTSFALSADTWTKVIKKIPGASGLSVNNDNGNGLNIQITPFYGTNFTTSGQAVDTWGTWSGSSRVPDMTNTWANTSNSTFELTGFQLEVGSQATPFEHRSFGEELALCQRYYYRINSTDNTIILFGDYNNSAGNFWANVIFPVTMRSAPTATITSLEGSGASIQSTTSSVHMLNLNTSNGATYIGNSTVVEASAEL